MPLAVQGSNLTSFDEFPISFRRSLRRQSSCPSSIPRSVSAGSSFSAFDSSSEDSGEYDDAERYMSPLFRRGLGGLGEPAGEAVERVSATSTGVFVPEEKAIDYDDSVFDSLSNYQFDIIGHDHIPEPTEVSEVKPSMQQSSTPAHPRSLPAPNRPLNSKASQPLPPLPDSLPHLPPSVPPKATKPIVPPNTGIRPLQIDRSKKRTGPPSTTQRTARADVPHAPLTLKPISRAITQGNLRDAYNRSSPLAERNVPTRGGVPVMPSYRHLAYPEASNRKVSPPIHPTQQQIPISTLFSTDLIPLQRAQDKFKHAHCLERLPPQPDFVESTLPPGNQGQWTRWSFGRAFKKQKA